MRKVIGKSSGAHLLKGIGAGSLLRVNDGIRRRQNIPALLSLAPKAGLMVVKHYNRHALFLRKRNFLQRRNAVITGEKHFYAFCRKLLHRLQVQPVALLLPMRQIKNSIAATSQNRLI